MNDWKGTILPRAVEIVEGFTTGVTLRQLYYRLVSEELIENTPVRYSQLAKKSAEWRRRGEFPDLIDLGRKIHQPAYDDSVRSALQKTAWTYRRDRTEGQTYNVFLGVEKRGMVEQLRAWFGPRGLPVLPLGGYSSQTFVEDVKRAVEADGREAVLLYAGDLDPSGEDIGRDFSRRTACWHRAHRVALTEPQALRYDLPPLPGKTGDSRASRFIAKHGRLFQIEVDALSPDVLKTLFEKAVGRYWSDEAYQQSMSQEKQERDKLIVYADAWKG